MYRSLVREREAGRGGGKGKKERETGGIARCMQAHACTHTHTIIVEYHNGGCAVTKVDIIWIHVVQIGKEFLCSFSNGVIDD